MTRFRIGGSEIVIGVVGPDDLVERIMFMGDEEGAYEWRLVGSAHAAEQETRERLMKIADGIDVVLFTGPLQHDLARAGGELPVPATYVQFSGASMYAALLGGTLARQLDPARVSIDSISAADVADTYGELGVSVDGVHVRRYTDPAAMREFLPFHEELYRSGRTTGALTTVRTVARNLEAAGVPVRRMLPTKRTIRTALDTAALLGAGSKLEESQIAIALVELPITSRVGHAGPGNYRQQELKLSLHRALLTDARRMGATVMPRGDNGYLIIATMGSLAKATDGLRVAPFLDHIKAELGVTVEIGIGLGRTAHDAEANAAAALENARTAKSTAFLVDTDRHVVSLPARPRHLTAETADSRSLVKARKILERLVEQPDGDPKPRRIVDAEKVAQLLGLTPRSARRALNDLVHEGLAWPVPSARPAQAGRPRQQYRLIVEKLDP